MMRFDGPALESIRQALGLTGVGAQNTEFPDGVCDQVLDVAPFIRRGRTFADSSGIYIGEIPNVHGAAPAVVTTAVDLYAPTSPLGGYPATVPSGFDAWLFHSFAYRASGDALVYAQLGIVMPATRAAFGGGASTFPIRSYQIATLGELAFNVSYFRSIGDGLIGKTHAIRIPRGAQLQWATSGAGGAAATYQVDVTIGLFPAGMGQDAVGAV